MKPPLGVEADLHVHTTASDGHLGAAEVVQRAKDLGLKGLAITDHDTTSGLKEAGREARRQGVVLVAGVELSTVWQGLEVHVLGYALQPGHDILEDLLTRMRQGRQLRTRRMVELLNRLGYLVDLERVLALSRGESLGRPHLAQALVERGYVSSVREAFEQLIGEGCPAYVPRLKLPPEEAVHTVRAAAGVPVLAHPGLLPEESWPGLLDAVIPAGLAGLEVYYPEHTPQQVEILQGLAARDGLLATGGSDFHGDEAERPNLGECGVPLEVLLRVARAGYQGVAR